METRAVYSIRHGETPSFRGSLSVTTDGRVDALLRSIETAPRGTLPDPAWAAHPDERVGLALLARSETGRAESGLTATQRAGLWAAVWYAAWDRANAEGHLWTPLLDAAWCAGARMDRVLRQGARPLRNATDYVPPGIDEPSGEADGVTLPSMAFDGVPPAGGGVALGALAASHRWMGAQAWLRGERGASVGDILGQLGPFRAGIVLDAQAHHLRFSDPERVERFLDRTGPWAERIIGIVGRDVSLPDLVSEAALRWTLSSTAPRGAHVRAALRAHRDRAVAIEAERTGVENRHAVAAMRLAHPVRLGAAIERRLRSLVATLPQWCRDGEAGHFLSAVVERPVTDAETLERIAAFAPKADGDLLRAACWHPNADAAVWRRATRRAGWAKSTALHRHPAARLDPVVRGAYTDRTMKGEGVLEALVSDTDAADWADISRRALTVDPVRTVRALGALLPAPSLTHLAVDGAVLAALLRHRERTVREAALLLFTPQARGRTP